MTTKENVFEAVERIEEYLEGQRESQPGEGGDQDIETLLADWKRLRAPERFVQLACALQEIVAGEVFGHGTPADCFCKRGGLWNLPAYATELSPFRNDGLVFEWVTYAVTQAVEAHKALHPTLRDSCGDVLHLPAALEDRGALGAGGRLCDHTSDEQLKATKVGRCPICLCHAIDRREARVRELEAQVRELLEGRGAAPQ